MLVGIIPCAGRGTRLAPANPDVPKPLVPIAGKPLVYYSLSRIRQAGADRVVLVVGRHNQHIRQHIGDQYEGIPIDYVVQDPPRGLLDAVYQARGHVSDRFMTLLGDEIYVGSRHKDLVAYWSACPQLDGLVGYIPGQDWEAIRKNYSIAMQGRQIAQLVEKPQQQVNMLLGTGTWAFTTRFFDYAAQVLQDRPPDRQSFVDAIQLMIDDGCAVEGYDLGGEYINVNFPSDIERAEQLADIK